MEISSKVQSLTYMDDNIYLVGIPQKMPEVIHMLEHNFNFICLKLNKSKSWSTGKVHELQHNKKVKCHESPPLMSFESTVVPLSPKVVNTVKAIENGL